MKFEENPGHHWQEPDRVAEYLQSSDFRERERAAVLSLMTRLIIAEKDARLNILDIGSGHGPVAAACLDAFPNAHAIGLDISDAMMAAGRGRMARFGDRFEFVQAPAKDIELERGRYALAMCLGATFAYDGLPGTLDALAPAVRADGHLVDTLDRRVGDVTRLDAVQLARELLFRERLSPRAGRGEADEHAAQTPSPVGIDYLALVEAEHRAATKVSINYAALPDAEPDEHDGERDASPPRGVWHEPALPLDPVPDEAGRPDGHDDGDGDAPAGVAR